MTPFRRRWSRELLDFFFVLSQSKHTQSILRNNGIENWLSQSGWIVVVVDACCSVNGILQPGNLLFQSYTRVFSHVFQLLVFFFFLPNAIVHIAIRRMWRHNKKNYNKHCLVSMVENISGTFMSITWAHKLSFLCEMPVDVKFHLDWKSYIPTHCAIYWDGRKSPIK